MKSTLQLLTALTASAALAGSASAAVITGITSVDDLDFTNVVGAWNFSINSSTTQTVQGVDFTNVNSPVQNDGAGNGTFGDLTVAGQLKRFNNGGATITSGGTASDRTALTAIFDEQHTADAGAANDVSFDVAVANGTYKVQLLIGTWSAREFELETADDGGFSLGSYSNNATENIVITDDVTVTDGELNLTMVDPGGSSDPRRVYSGLIVSIPEPGSLALLGLGGLMLIKRRRRHA